MKLSDFPGITSSKGSIPTLEMIDFQRNDQFGASLEPLVEEIANIGTLSKFRKSGKVEEYEKKFSALVKERFNLNISVRLTKGLACADVNMLSSHNVLIASPFKDLHDRDPDKKLSVLDGIKNGARLGYIDQRKARVYGWLSTVPCSVDLNISDLSNHWNHTVQEIVAIFLHEVGHVFNALEYSARINKTNQTLAEIAGAVIGKSPDKVSIVYREIQQLDDSASRTIAEDICSGDSILIGRGAWELLGLSVKSLTGEYYADVSFEAMSDTFATRMGYGQYSAQTLAWLEEIDPTSTQVGEITKVMNRMFALAGLIGCLSILTAAVSPGIILPMIGVFTTVISAKLFGDAVTFARRSTWGMIYDDSKNRITRVKNQLVEDLKRREAPKDELESLIKSIRIVEGYISECPEYKTPVWTSITDSIFPKDARMKKGLEDHRVIESLVANDLFLSSSRLRVKTL